MIRTAKMCEKRGNFLSVISASQFVFLFSLSTFLLISIADGQLSQDEGQDATEWIPPHHYTHAIQRSYSAAIRPDAQLPDHESLEQLSPEHHDPDNSPLQRLRRSSYEGDEEEEDDEETKEEARNGEEDQQPKAQHFFPSFAPLFSPPPPLGHSRPPFYNQESAFSQRPSYPGGFRDLSYPHAVAESESSTNVLGSGNFGVLRGGTFFAGERDELLSDDLYSPYFHGGNNGHGRPSSFYPRNPQPNYRQQGDDFFANFRDFADISTPTKSSYSQYYVVYARQNATQNENLPKPKLLDDDVEDYREVQPHNTHQRPRNIIEQLSMLDATNPTHEVPTTKKFTKRKLKLHIYKKKLEEKLDRAAMKSSTVSPKDIYDPLLALS